MSSSEVSTDRNGQVMSHSVYFLCVFISSTCLFSLPLFSACLLCLSLLCLSQFPLYIFSSATICALSVGIFCAVSLPVALLCLLHFLSALVSGLFLFLYISLLWLSIYNLPPLTVLVLSSLSCLSYTYHVSVVFHKILAHFAFFVPYYIQKINLLHVLFLRIVTFMSLL